MGYTHDTGMVKIVPPASMTFNGGNWSDVVASNQWSKDKAAAADTTLVRIPITPPQNEKASKGSLLKSIDLWYGVTAAALNTLTPVLYRLAAPGDNAVPAAPGALEFTYDAGHDTNGKRVAVQNHRMTLTLNAPVWLGADDVVFIELSVVATATSVIKMKEARIHTTFRV